MVLSRWNIPALPAGVLLSFVSEGHWGNKTGGSCFLLPQAPALQAAPVAPSSCSEVRAAPSSSPEWLPVAVLWPRLSAPGEMSPTHSFLPHSFPRGKIWGEVQRMDFQQVPPVPAPQWPVCHPVSQGCALPSEAWVSALPGCASQAWEAVAAPTSFRVLVPSYLGIWYPNPLLQLLFFTLNVPCSNFYVVSLSWRKQD